MFSSSQLTMNKFANTEKETLKQYGELFPEERKEKAFFPLLFCILPPGFTMGGPIILFS